MRHLPLRLLFAALLLCALRGVGACDDSMASFRALLEFSRPSATDVGAMIAPEIFAVNHYPLRPRAGQDILIRARVGVYNSMAPYKITDVSLTAWTRNTPPRIIPMKLEDADQDLYSATVPGVKNGEELFYTVSAHDDWGNAAVELAPGAPAQIVLEDAKDDALNPSLDVRKIEAMYDATERLRLCVETRAKARRVIGQDPAAYGIFVLANDVRYKPSLTESEMMEAWMAAYFPYLGIKDLMPAGELLSAATGSGKHAKRATFSEQGNALCFTFDPRAVRADFHNGLKLAGVTITASLSPMAMKPMDTTHMVMLYPGGHSVRVEATP